jgi:hypothetical protein
VHSLDPTGWTGGRVYLRMVHAELHDVATLHTLPDPKRGYRHRRWRKLRHLAELAPRIRALRHADGVLIWDDLSVLQFTADMRSRTVFVLHHHDPLHYDSWPIEPLLWRALPAALRKCAAVVCVSPYWARHLARHRIDAHVIPNAYDTNTIAAVRGEDRAQLRRRFALPGDRLLVYVGKAVHGKGVDIAHQLLGADPRVQLVSTGNNTIGARTLHLGWLPYRDHLRVVRACDVGLFLPQLREGWSRCAAEAILLDLPCLTNDSGGLADLAALTDQPTADPSRLAQQLLDRATTPANERVAARQRLEVHDRAHFGRQWRRLVTSTATRAPATGDAATAPRPSRPR